MKIINVIYFPLIMAILSLLHYFRIIFSIIRSLNYGYINWIGFIVALFIFCIPFFGFITMLFFHKIKKLHNIVTAKLTLIWILFCLPITWLIAAIIQKYFYLGVELYF